MGIDKLQASRFEQKYIINDETALQVREFVRQYLELDENGVGKPNYSIRSTASISIQMI